MVTSRVSPIGDTAPARAERRDVYAIRDCCVKKVQHVTARKPLASHAIMGLPSSAGIKGRDDLTKEDALATWNRPKAWPVRKHPD